MARPRRYIVAIVLFGALGAVSLSGASAATGGEGSVKPVVSVSDRDSCPLDGHDEYLASLVDET